MHARGKPYTVNDKSYAREKFHGLMGFVIMLGKLLQFCFYLYFSLTAKLIRENFCDSLIVGSIGSSL